MEFWKCTSTIIVFLSVISILSTWFFIQYLGNISIQINEREDLDIYNEIRLFNNITKQATETDTDKQAGEHPVEVIKLQLFVQSAIVNYNRSNKTHTAVMITAWNYHRNKNSFFCCFRLREGNLIVIPAVFLFRHNQGLLSANQFGCYISKTQSFQNHIFFSVNDCISHVTQSIPIVYPEMNEGKMAICLKTVYNKLDVQQMVEWFELQKLLGVHKIQAFKFQLEKDQNTVLDYYYNQGFLHLQTLFLPVGFGAPTGRGFRLEERPYENQFQADEQITLYDCVDRLSGYDYVGVYDIDEVVLPGANISLPDFFRKMVTLHPYSGAFFFKTEHFPKEWGKTNNDTDLTLMTHVYRMPAARRREKLLHIPKKTVMLDTHHVTLTGNYYALFLEADEAVLHRYSTCLPKEQPVCASSSRTEDRDLLRYQTALRVRTKQALEEIRKFLNK